MMPYRRRAGTRKKKRAYTTRRRYARKSTTRTTRIFNFKRSFDGSTVSALGSRALSQTLLSQNINLEFTLAMLPNSGEFGSLFDQYRINKIQFKFTPMANLNATGSVSTVNPGLIATVVDYDGGSALTSLSEYQQFSTYKEAAIVRQRTMVRTWKPRILIAAQQIGGANPAVINKGGQWIDAANLNITHQGLKVYIDPYATSGAAQTFQVTGTMWFSCRNTR